MIFRILVVFIFAFCVNANAQGIPPKMQTILTQAMSADGSGYLTQQMHKDFWSEVRRLGTPQEIESFKKILNVNILGAQEYQKEIWGSAKISYENNTIVKTQRLIELETELPIKFEKSLAIPKSSANYRQAMSLYSQQMKVSMENSKRLLGAAAKRSSMTSAQGQNIPLDLNMINTVLNNLNSSFTRLENLFNENWNGK